MSQQRNNHSQRLQSQGVAILSWVVLLILFSGLAIRLVQSASASQPEQPDAPDVFVYMPLMQRITVFNPTEDITLAGGSYTFAEVDIPSGVTVTALGDVVLNVLGLTNIRGTLTGDCTQIEIHSKGDISIAGIVDNECSSETTDPGNLVIYTYGGNLAVGSPTAQAILDTSGDLDIANDPSLQEWEFDVLPDQRSATPLPPACAGRADRLQDTVVPGFPMDVLFSGEGADPDGGPVSYAWDFGDGGTSSERDPLHAYITSGVFDVILSVTDDDGETCQATLRIVMDDDVTLPPEPGVWGGPYDLVVPINQVASFSSSALDPQGEVLTYTWDFGDAFGGSGPSPTHTYTLAGRYPVTLTVNDESGNFSTATGAIYAYAPPPPLELSTGIASIEQDGDCLIPGDNVFNINYDGGTAPTGSDGRRAIFRGTGFVVLGQGSSIQAQHGGNGTDRTGSGDVMGGRGGRGGDLQILVAGTLMVCENTTLAAGNGGNGGSALSDTPAPGMAWASGGNGGEAARLLRLAATQAIIFDATFGGTVTLKPGDGGNGGTADAIGGDGEANCPVGKDGASAKAYGGDGGKASKSAFVSGAVSGLANVEIQGGMGGDGAPGNAYGGDGGNAICAGTATGGIGKAATSRGGKGGEAKLSGMGGAFTLAPDAFTAGGGGYSYAASGAGGDAEATPPGACAATTATGGVAGKATARGGNGAAGVHSGSGGDSDAVGGIGGEAVATGGDCDNCGNGGGATATGGRGGDADANYGKRGGADGSDGIATANGGDGGVSDALGGRGGDCPTCPAGKGGNGGPGSATGGDGGNGAGNGFIFGGDGGIGDANGGRGGDGADCCEKLNEQPGGNGGDGGDANSIAGNPGQPGGAFGANATKGGDGGTGGDGLPPGQGGPPGTGTGVPVDIPDGIEGEDGVPCTWTIWFIYHSTIPDGVIIPGFEIELTVYPTRTTEITPTGVVTAHFLTEQEFGHPVSYFKQQNLVIVQSGGIRYDLSGIDPTVFPIYSVRSMLDDACGFQDCIQLVGYYQGGEISRVGNTDGMGVETLELPPAAPEAPYYDEAILFGLAPFSFDHWWIMIIDP